LAACASAIGTRETARSSRSPARGSKAGEGIRTLNFQHGRLAAELPEPLENKDDPCESGSVCTPVCTSTTENTNAGTPSPSLAALADALARLTPDQRAAIAALLTATNTPPR